MKGLFTSTRALVRAAQGWIATLTMMGGGQILLIQSQNTLSVQIILDQTSRQSKTQNTCLSRKSNISTSVISKKLRFKSFCHNCFYYPISHQLLVSWSSQSHKNQEPRKNFCGNSVNLLLSSAEIRVTREAQASENWKFWNVPAS